MTNYETTYIAFPDAPEKKISEINSKLTDIIGKFKGEVKIVDDWGVRQLGYSIKRQQRGHYVHLQYRAEGNVAKELERTLLLRDDILKQLTIKIGKENAS